MTGVGALAQSERVRLEAERDHLLVSLDDLDAELAAGDIDKTDFDNLRDDYTSRAAHLTRALRAGTVRRRTRDRGPLAARLVWIGLIVAIALGAASMMATFSGARGRGQTATGEIRLSSTSLLADAAEAFGAGDPERAIELYGEVIAIQPTNVEALTYRGWVRYQMGEVESGRADFAEAISFDSEYSDVRVFSAVAALGAGELELAAAELAAFDLSSPSAVAEQLVAQRQLRERVTVARVLERIDASDGRFDLDAAGLTIDEVQLAGEVFLQLEEPTNALISFDAILTAIPESAAAMAWRGWTLAVAAESGADTLWPEAQRWLDAAVEADPTYPDARVFRTFVFRRLDQIDEARAELLVFDSLAEQPADMVSLIDDFELREALDL